MKLFQIDISNFRGIKRLLWQINSPINCLIGVGDSTKTTILDAIEYTLSSQWNISFDDSDFYKGKTNDPIVITATVGGLPQELISEDKYGLYLRGWSAANILNDEPQEGDEEVLSIRLKVDDLLEPEWTVVNNRMDSERHISARDRSKFQVSRIGSFVDRHLSWGRGSLLTKISDDAGDASGALMALNRRARAGFNLKDDEQFKQIIEQAESSAAKVGVKPSEEFCAHIDSRSMNTSNASIAIHDGSVPVRLAGMGSKRLIALGLQIESLALGSIVLIDEVEQGLEPHRIRHLLRMLCDKITSAERAALGQVILTTHSSITLVELGGTPLSRVTSNKSTGETECIGCGAQLDSLVRSVPEAFLGRKIIVCEGATEEGFCMALDELWRNENSNNSFGYTGTVIANGGGSQSLTRAINLLKIGYPLTLFMDSDVIESTDADIKTFCTLGGQLIMWSGKVSIEEAIVNMLPFHAISEVIKCAIKIKCDEEGIDDTHSKSAVFDTIRNRMNIDNRRNLSDFDINVWAANGIVEQDIRSAIGKSAKKCKWFKRVKYGQVLGGIVVKHLSSIPNTDLALKISVLKKWIYG